jgi:DNA-binding winged helix-turn-helix (wHTH) protein/tetratricopeptide (TPR) repeat protein
MESKGFRFASFLLDAGRHRLSGPDGEIRLRPKSFEVLALLLGRAGQLVSKDEIQHAVWPDVVVTDDSLTRCISDVRLALKDSDHTLIRTVAKRGYLIDIPVRAAAAPLTHTPATPTPVQRAQDPVQREGGRRLASAVYVDVRHQIEALAQCDAEAALSRYEAVVAHVSQVLRDLGGTVQLVPGEGVAGLFGVPTAQEDHAWRACQAALRCHGSPGTQRGSAAPLRSRIGIASGSVVFRSIDGGPEPMWSALGPTIDEARRLGRTAAEGATLISDATRRQVEGRFLLADAGPMPAGNNEGARLLESSLTRSSRFKAAMARGLTRLVGREDELAQLHRAERLAASGKGQLVSLVGEAGVGKSRLAYELVQSLGRSRDWRLLDCAAVPYGKSSSYLPMIELLQRYLGIEAHDDVDVMQGKLRANLGAAGGTAMAGLPALQSLLEVPVDDAAWGALDPGQRRSRTIEALVQLLLREASAQPCVLLIEDLHWADAQTQAVLDALVTGLGPARLLVLLTYRPDYRHGWASLSTYTQVRLDTLAPESSGQVLDILLGHDPALQRLKHLLLQHGNPFFLEEAVRTLVDSGALVGERSAYRLAQAVDAIRIPATVEAMLAARIDHLSPADRRVLEGAAVVGSDIPLPLLLAVTGKHEGPLLDALQRLQSAEFLVRAGSPAQAAYSFRHALVQEVAYGGLLQARRRELHTLAFQALETFHGDRVGEHTERLAHHARRGELGPKAVHYLRQAGLKAAKRSALADARHWFEQALECQGGLPETLPNPEQEFEIRLELRGVLYQLGDPRAVLACLREAQTIARRLKDESRQVRVAAFITSVHTMLGQLEDAVAIGQAARQAARQHGELELCIHASNFLVQAHYYRGDYDSVLELATENLANWPDSWAYRYHLGNPAPASIFNRAFMAMSLAQLGRFDEAAAYETQAIELAEPTQNAFAIAVAHVSVPVLHALRGDWSTARSRVERSIAAARAGNVVGFLSPALAASAWILAESGEPGEAERRMEEARSLLDQQSANGIGNVGGAYASLGRACVVLQLVDEARTFGLRALALSQSQSGLAAHALLLLGDIGRTAVAGGGDSEASYRKALGLAAPRGMRPLEMRCHAGLAALLRSQGRYQEADHHLSVCADIQSELG